MFLLRTVNMGKWENGRQLRLEIDLLNIYYLGGNKADDRLAGYRGSTAAVSGCPSELPAVVVSANNYRIVHVHFPTWCWYYSIIINNSLIFMQNRGLRYWK